MKDSVASSFTTMQEDVLFDVPYSSAAPFHEYYGDGPPPSRLGMGCGWQSFEVARRVRERTGVKATLLFSGRHIVAVYPGADDLVVLDPYLLHRLPVVLRRADAADGVVTATEDAFPFRTTASGEPRPSKLRLRWTPTSGGMHSEYSRYSPRLDRYVTFRAFTFRPGSRLPAFPPPRGLVLRLLLHAEQNNVSIRSIDRDSGRMRELVLPFTGRPRDQLVDERFLITKDNQGAVSHAGTDGFQRDLTEICASVAGSPEELVGYLLGAAEIYAAKAPEDLEVPEYSLEDE
ncbi:hypothetical protein [Actinoplanes regularis]|uniref:hypothetical protein n=1 Tax=Actinoplanes regularis TaxID=52697 RepID=UPI0024A3E449|nr:hypothetical protein [Actinoplanes regularis]GLW27612.1 hypothetical protein Areg01_05530 [Actinoplanes regularis]